MTTTDSPQSPAAGAVAAEPDGGGPATPIVSTVTPTVEKGPARPPKKRAKAVLLTLLAVASLAVATAWLVSRGKESTDDAQVEAHILSVSARTAGQVLKVLAQDNQLVEAGTVLVELDKSELEARAAAARADRAAAKASLELAGAQLGLTEKNAGASLVQARGGLSQAASGVTSTKAALEQARADVAAAEARLRLAKLELERSKQLFSQGSGTQADVDARQAAFDQATAALDQAKARSDGTQAAITGGIAGVEQATGRLEAAQTGPLQVQAASAQVALADARLQQTESALKLAELSLSYATIRSPARGFVTRRTVEVGNMVSPDRPLLAIVPLDDVWIVANFKESQIGDMRSGQAADVQVDAYGGRTFHGHVESLSAGTGSRFALLPPDNASGNYVKVVQRVPVLIRLDAPPDGELRPGMSADVTVRLR